MKEIHDSDLNFIRAHAILKAFFLNEEEGGNMSEETWYYDVVGVTFEGRQQILNDFYKNYKVGGFHEVKLECEPDNQYDQNAIGVHLDVGGSDFKQVGYISRMDNVRLGNMLKTGKFKRASLCSMGPNSKGELGLKIQAVFDK